MLHRASVSRLSRILLACASVLTAVWGQSFQGGVRGVVLDQAGAAIANAKVMLVDEATSVSRATITSAEGEYVFNQVVPATYSVAAESPGFKKIERKGVVVGTQQFLTLDLKLELGQVSESVQVTEDVPLLETANASQGQVIDRQKLVDLPNLGRNPFMMSRLAQNVVQVGNPGYNRMQTRAAHRRSLSPAVRYAGTTICSMASPSPTLSTGRS